MKADLIHIIDFDDSFTLNIAAHLSALNTPFRIINWQSWEKERDLHPQVLLGPGPGHPAEYRSIFKRIETLLKLPGAFVMGICLGHQLIHHLLGYKIIPWKHPLHGQARPLDPRFFSWLEGKEMPLLSGKVQFYNSWGVEYCPPGASQLFCQQADGEKQVWSGKGVRHLSFQFHPESIGTTFPHRLFTPLLQKLDMIGGEHDLQNNRNIR